MHRVWLLFVVACSYDPSRVGDEDGVDGNVGPIDAMCLAHDQPTLCMEFEDDLTAGIVRDGSTNQFVASADNLGSLTRTAPAGPTAARFDVLPDLSELTIDANLGLAGSISVEMWMKLEPSLTTRRFLFDSAGAFVVSYGDNDGEIRCGINFEGEDDDDLRVDSDTTIVDNDWHHVACTFDSTSRQMQVYVDGSVAGCKQLDSTITPKTGATTIGAPHFPSLDLFIGALDSIHVYKRVLTPSQVCDSALGDHCTATCPIPQPEQGSGQGGGPGGP